MISSGAGNTLGRPDKDVLERLKSTIHYPTDLSGTIESTTDGERLGQDGPIKRFRGRIVSVGE